MKFQEVSFFKSVGLSSKEVFFDTRKEIIFVGRSNVGKSSLMNALFGKKDLVKTSSKPGKTKLANIFLVGHKYYFTDLPGYGFAKVSKDMQQELDGLISWYVEERRDNISAGVLLVDSKIGPQDIDVQMYRYFLDLGIHMVIVLSKTDKVSRKDIDACIRKCESAFFGQKIFSVSSSKGTHISDLQKYFTSILTSK